MGKEVVPTEVLTEGEDSASQGDSILNIEETADRGKIAEATETDR